MSELRVIVTGGQTRDTHKDYPTLADIIATRERVLMEEGMVVAVWSLSSRVVLMVRMPWRVVWLGADISHETMNSFI